MVIPATPRSFSAPFTSSSLNGLRTATTSFTPVLPSIGTASTRASPNRRQTGTVPSPPRARPSEPLGGAVGAGAFGGRAGGHHPLGRGRQGRHPLGEGLLRVGLLIVDGHVADLEHLGRLA